MEVFCNSNTERKDAPQILNCQDGLKDATAATYHCSDGSPASKSKSLFSGLAQYQKMSSLSWKRPLRPPPTPQPALASKKTKCGTMMCQEEHNVLNAGFLEAPKPEPKLIQPCLNNMINPHEYPLTSKVWYPAVIVQENWCDVIAKSGDIRNSSKSMFTLELLFSAPKNASFSFVFLAVRNLLIGGIDHEAKLVAPKCCLIKVGGSVKSFEPGAVLFQSFHIIFPFRDIQLPSLLPLIPEIYNIKDPDTDVITAIVVTSNRIACGFQSGKISLSFLASAALDTFISLPLLGHNGKIKKLGFFENDKKLYSLSEDCTALVWNVKTRTVVSCFRGHRQGITDGFMLNREVPRLVTVSDDCSIRTWDVESGCMLNEINIGSPVLAAALMPGTECTDNPIGAFATETGTVYGLPLGSSISGPVGGSARTVRPCFSISHRFRPQALAFLCPELLAVGYSGGNISVWNVCTREVARTVNLSYSDIRQLLHIDRRQLIAVSDMGGIVGLATNKMYDLPLTTVYTGFEIGRHSYVVTSYASQNSGVPVLYVACPKSLIRCLAAT